MLKTLKKDLNADVSAATAKKVMDALRTDFWTEDFRDLPKGTEGVILTLSYSVPDVKVRPKVGEAIDWDKHELRVGDRVEHPKLSIDGRPQGTVTITRLLKSCPGFLYLRPDGIEDSGQSNKTWIFKGSAKVRPTIGTKLDFEKHTLEIGDYISKDEGSVYRVTSKERFDYKFRPNVPAYTIEPVSGADRYETWAWLADFWTLTSAPLAHPALGEKIFFFKHELKIGDFIKGPYDSDVYEVIACRKNEYDVKNVVSGTVIQAYASDYWVRVEKPVLGLKVKVGDRVRWTSGDEWTEGRVYEVTSSYFKYIRDKVGNTDLRVGEVAAFPLVNGVYLDKNVKVIAD